VRFFLLAAVILSLCAPATGQRKKKPADVEVMETRARRDQGKITLDGRVRFTGERPARGLVIVFDFLSPEHKVVTSQKTQVADDVVRAGQEASYQTVLVDPVRAVSYQVRASDTGERDLRVANPGPYPIE
jgi:predicted NBD/HSP70 family sugar kinase